MLLLPATDDDVPFLWEMLAQAALPSGGELPAGLMADDHIRRYLDGWGRPGDTGLVAWDDGRPLGAVWLRLLAPGRPGYGFVDAATPELSVAVVPGARGRGVGRALVAGALDVAAACGHRQVSLSVAATNEVAAALYRSLGFAAIATDDGGSSTMVAPAAPAPPSDGQTPGPARLATATDGPAAARLRQVMLDADDRTWLDPFLRHWPTEVAAGRWLATVVDGPPGRPVASALATVMVAPPGPGRVDGRTAHVGSVATEPGWRRRGAARAAVGALVEHLDRHDVSTSTLTASAEGAGLYRSLGYEPSTGTAMRRNRP